MKLRRAPLALGLAVLGLGLFWIYSMATESVSSTYRNGGFETSETRSYLFDREVPKALVDVLPALALAAWIGSSALCAREAGRQAGRWFVAMAAFALICGIYVTTFHLHMGGLGILLLFGVLAIPWVFVFGITWASRELRGLGQYGGIVLVLLFTASFVVLPFVPYGLQLAVLVSRPSLSELVDRVRASESVDMPTRAGLFSVRAIQTKGHVVALVLHDDPGGSCALVHFPDGSRGDADENGGEHLAFYGPMYNLNWNVALGGGWRYQVED